MFAKILELALDLIDGNDDTIAESFVRECTLDLIGQYWKLAGKMPVTRCIVYAKSTGYLYPVVAHADGLLLIQDNEGIMNEGIMTVVSQSDYEPLPHDYVTGIQYSWNMPVSQRYSILLSH